jgi:ligand-binding sensor domain-containing protein
MPLAWKNAEPLCAYNPVSCNHQRPPANQKQYKPPSKIFRQVTSCKLKKPTISLLLISIFFTSCNGQTSTNQTKNNINSTHKTEQYPKIIRTQGTQSEVLVCQLLDKDGNLWFSIRGEGIYRYDGVSFTNFTIKDGLCSNNVVAIIQDKSGKLLLGTNRGICVYEDTIFKKHPVLDTFSITCMLEDREGDLWFGTGVNGIYRYNGKTLDNFLNSNKQEYNLGENNQFILDILQDKNGNIWFSSWNGGGVWRYDGKDFKNFLPSEDYYKTNQDKRKFNNPQRTFENRLSTSYSPSQENITDDMIFSMTEDNVGNIWFATRDHGICYYNGKTFTTIGRKEGFDSRGAKAILQDDKNNFWVTTSDSGVWYYDGKTYKNFNEKNGLVNNAVMNVLKDKNGNLWFGTKFFGLSRYDGKTFTTFSKYDN